VIEVSFVTQAKQFLKKCNPKLRDLFKDKLSAIYDDIEAGIPLAGDLAGCYKIKIDYGGVKYRVVYEIIDETTVVVVYCSLRKDAYQTIKRSGVVKGVVRKKKSQ